MSKLLYDTPEEGLKDPNSLVLYPNLACEIGVLPALILGTIKQHGKINLEKMEGFVSKDTIKRAIRKLGKLGLIPKNILSPEQIAEILQSKRTEEIGQYVCEWCGSKTLLLHRHHFPVSKLNGGKDIVKICGTCHYEYHHLQRKSWVVQ